MTCESKEPPRSARWIQQTFFENFGHYNWDEYKDDKYLIKQKIAYALFGPPSQEADLVALSEKSTFGYSDDQLKFVIPLYEKIKTYSKYAPNKKSIYMSVLFVCLVPKVPEIPNIHLLDNLEFTASQLRIEPVFRIRKCIKTDTSDGETGCCFFIDSSQRVYRNWEDYVNNNLLDEGVVIAPENGQYNGVCIGGELHVKLQIQLSPASTVGAKIKSAAEITSTCVAVSTVGVIGASLLFPIAAPVMIGAAVASVATGVFGIASSSAHLHDRAQHDQEIGLQNPQSRGSWINIAASTTGLAAGASSTLLSKAAGSGVAVGKGFQVLHDTASIVTLVVSGAGVANSFFNFYTQYQETNKLPSNLELFQFASSVLFFTNSIVSVKMAKTLIQESQTASISSFRDTLSNKQRKMFDKMSGETRRLEGTMKGNAEIIRSSNVISDNKQFFGKLKSVNKHLNENGVRISFKDGNALLNGKHVISPSEFHAMDVSLRSSYLATIGNADLAVPNAQTRLSTQPASVAPISSNLGTLITSVIHVSTLIQSFPDIAGNDEMLLRFIASKMTTIINDKRLYDLFVDLINWLYSHIGPDLREVLAILDLNGTNLFFKLFEHTYEFLRNIVGDDSGIPDALALYFRNGAVHEDRVVNILKYFKDKIFDDYKDFRRNEIRCKICHGVTFFSD